MALGAPTGEEKETPSPLLRYQMGQGISTRLARTGAKPTVDKEMSMSLKDKVAEIAQIARVAGIEAAGLKWYRGVSNLWLQDHRRGGRGRDHV